MGLIVLRVASWAMADSFRNPDLRQILGLTATLGEKRELFWTRKPIECDWVERANLYLDCINKLPIIFPLEEILVRKASACRYILFYKKFSQRNALVLTWIYRNVWIKKYVCCVKWHLLRWPAIVPAGQFYKSSCDELISPITLHGRTLTSNYFWTLV